MEKIPVQEAILVEGRYDAHALRALVDGVVLEAGGFSLLRGGARLALLRRYAEGAGLIILTDSDRAGLFLRGRLKGMLPKGRVLHAYVPPVAGKEKRKARPSADGLLGVEAMPREVLLDALRRAGATIAGETPWKREGWQKGDLYAAGLLGRADSRKKRARLQEALALPPGLSANALLDALNRLFSAEEVRAALEMVEERDTIGR